MKNLIIIVVASFLLTSCGQELTAFRVKTINGGDIITFNKNSEKAKFYMVGDTLTIKRFGYYDKTWEIINGPRIKDDVGVTEAWYSKDSTRYGGNFYAYKNVVIEKIFKKE